jgi:hypothetical protein
MWCFGTPARYQFLGKPVFCAVALDPEFSVADINMNETTVHSFAVDSPDVHKHVSIAHAIENGFRLDVAAGIMINTFSGVHEEVAPVTIEQLRQFSKPLRLSPSRSTSRMDATSKCGIASLSLNLPAGAQSSSTTTTMNSD